MGHSASVVLVSSLSPGVLRLLLPFRDEANTGQGAMHSRTYDPGNLLMEARMDAPVLQIAVGRLSPA